MKATKPLGMPAYGSIPHLPGSRTGPADHTISEGQAKICTEKPRDKYDRIYVTTKYDGSCVSVAKINGKIVPLMRAGYRAEDSKYLQHHLFHRWVMTGTMYFYTNSGMRLQATPESRFFQMLKEGERAVGEWLIQAHGTRYVFSHLDHPFIMFDIMSGHERKPWNDVKASAEVWGFKAATDISGPEHKTPMSPLTAMQTLHYLRKQPPASQIPVVHKDDLNEGAVWRVERHEPGKPPRFDFMAKWVNAKKVDGLYLPEQNGGETIWNLRL